MSEQLRQRVIDAASGVGADFTTMECDPDLADTAVFCEHYGIPSEQSANAIVLASKRPQGIHGVFLVLATTRLDVNGAARSLMGVKKVSFAPPELSAEVTGMVMGGVTPFGLPPSLPIYVDSRVMDQTWVVVGGGSRDMKIKVDPEVFGRMDGCTVVEGLAREMDPR